MKKGKKRWKNSKKFQEDNNKKQSVVCQACEKRDISKCLLLFCMWIGQFQASLNIYIYIFSPICKKERRLNMAELHVTASSKLGQILSLPLSLSFSLITSAVERKKISYFVSSLPAAGAALIWWGGGARNGLISYQFFPQGPLNAKPQRSPLLANAYIIWLVWYGMVYYNKPDVQKGLHWAKIVKPHDVLTVFVFVQLTTSTAMD